MTFWQLTIDAREPEVLARFWAVALEYRPAPPTEPDTTWTAHYRRRLGDAEAFSDRIFDPAGVRPPLWFQQVPEDKVGKNRVHVDVYVTGRDDALTVPERVELVEAKVAELRALGGHVQRRVRFDNPDDPGYWVTMHDPEGNEFCVS